MRLGERVYKKSTTSHSDHSVSFGPEKKKKNKPPLTYGPFLNDENGQVGSVSAQLGRTHTPALFLTTTGFQRTQGPEVTSARSRNHGALKRQSVDLPNYSTTNLFPILYTLCL